jgi:hypothetical protein
LTKEINAGIKPFYFFGLEENTPWFRLFVGTCSIDNAKIGSDLISRAIQNLS